MMLPYPQLHERGKGIFFLQLLPNFLVGYNLLPVQKMLFYYNINQGII